MLFTGTLDRTIMEHYPYAAQHAATGEDFEYGRTKAISPAPVVIRRVSLSERYEWYRCTRMTSAGEPREDAVIAFEPATGAYWFCGGTSSVPHIPYTDPRPRKEPLRAGWWASMCVAWLEQQRTQPRDLVGALRAVLHG
jgi:hypothetical protein